MASHIRVAILDNHQSIIDGYIYRLTQDPSIRVVGSAVFGDDLEPMLASRTADVLLLGLSVPNSSENHTPFPALFIIPRLMRNNPDLKILVISVLNRPSLIEALVETGISGYILKNDQASIQGLATIVGAIAHGGKYFSKIAHQELRQQTGEIHLPRPQLEALSLCASRPEGDAVSLAKMLGIAESTLRNRLSVAYRQLGVRSRSAAVMKAQELGILPVLVDGQIPEKAK